MRKTTSACTPGEADSSKSKRGCTASCVDFRILALGFVLCAPIRVLYSRVMSYMLAVSLVLRAKTVSYTAFVIDCALLKLPSLFSPEKFRASNPKSELGLTEGV